MTREDIINRIVKDVSNEFRYNDLTEIIDSGAVEFVVDEMIYIFESRTSCDGCRHKPKDDEDYQEDCLSCSRFYGDYWESKND